MTAEALPPPYGIAYDASGIAYDSFPLGDYNITDGAVITVALRTVPLSESHTTTSSSATTTSSAAGGTSSTLPCEDLMKRALNPQEFRLAKHQREQAAADAMMASLLAEEAVRAEAEAAKASKNAKKKARKKAAKAAATDVGEAATSSSALQLETPPEAEAEEVMVAVPAPAAAMEAASTAAAPSAEAEVDAAADPAPAPEPPDEPLRPIQHEPVAVPVPAAAHVGGRSSRGGRGGRGGRSGKGTPSPLPPSAPAVEPTPFVPLSHASLDVGRRDVDESTMGGGTTCTVCFEGAKDHLALPCAHLCACAHCAGLLEGKECPICRAKVATWIKVHIA